MCSSTTDTLLGSPLLIQQSCPQVFRNLCLRILASRKQSPRCRTRSPICLLARLLVSLSPRPVYLQALVWRIWATAWTWLPTVSTTPSFSRGGSPISECRVPSAVPSQCGNSTPGFDCPIGYPASISVFGSPALIRHSNSVTSHAMPLSSFIYWPCLVPTTLGC